MVNLDTTNWLLGIIAVASAVQMLFLIAAGIMGFRLYRQLSTTAAELESRHLAPLRRQVDEILGDVHRITARVDNQTEWVDQAISGTIDRVDETAERVRYSVREKVSRATGFVRGVRAIIMSILTPDASHEPRAQAGGRI